MIRASRKEKILFGIGVAMALTIGLFQNQSSVTPANICSSGTSEQRVACAITEAVKIGQATSRPITNESLVLHAVDHLGFGMSPQLSPLSSAKTRSGVGTLVSSKVVEQIAGKGAIRPEHTALIKRELIFENLTEKEQYSLASSVASLVAVLDADVKALENARQPVPEDLREALRSLRAKANDIRGETEHSMYQRKLLTNLVGSMAWTKADASDAVDAQMNLGDVMTEFWFNHFNVDRKKVDRFTYSYDRVIRHHAFGTFKNLLTAVMKNPAMLVYLDNQSNVRQKVGDKWYGSNQNLARELLELHTTGRGPVTTRSAAGDYTQTDVEGVAQILTGHGVSTTNAQTIEGMPSHYLFNVAGHIPPEVRPVVMGRTFSQVGEAKALELYSVLSNLARTKANICSKLTMRLAGATAQTYDSAEKKWKIESDSSILTGRCVAAWGTDGDISKMIVAIVSSPEFWHPARIKNSVKSPLELVISAHRASGLNPAHIDASPTTAAVGNTVFADNRTITIRRGNKLLYDIRGQIHRLGLDYRGVVPPIGYSENRITWLSPSYLVNSTTVLNSIVDTMPYALTAPGIEFGQLRAGRRGYAAHSEFDRIFAYQAALPRGPASDYEINRYLKDSFGHQILASGPKNFSVGFTKKVVSTESLSDQSKLDMIRSDRVTGIPENCQRVVGGRTYKGYCSALRTVFTDYVTSREFIRK